MKTLSDIGELAAIERVKRFLPLRADIVRGVGDDCAVVRADKTSPLDWLLTSDAVVQGVHFDRSAAPAQIGHKAIGRALSDLAAMGGEPKWALIDIVAPPALPVKTLDGVYAGMSALADRYGLAIVGGDMAQGPALEIHVFALGSAPRDKAVLRSGAKPGDIVFVTGSLGGSLNGRHLRFEPRVREGIFLRKWASAMIDVTDGLASDLRHVIDMSGVGARISAKQTPISADAKRMPGSRSPFERALYDGEDFELLFTIPRLRKTSFLREWKKRFSLKISDIGVITDETGALEIVDERGNVKRIEKNGFQHFERH